jgi:hypothetical protein
MQFVTVPPTDQFSIAAAATAAQTARPAPRHRRLIITEEDYLPTDARYLYSGANVNYYRDEAPQEKRSLPAKELAALDSTGTRKRQREGPEAKKSKQTSEPSSLSSRPSSISSSSSSNSRRKQEKESKMFRKRP